jgi:putative chitinase
MSALTIRTAAQWAGILSVCGVAATTTARWAEPFAEAVNTGAFSKGDDDVRDWLPEILWESMLLERLEENLNYAAEALVSVFSIHRITPAQAMQVGRITGKQSADPRAIANIVYGGAWGRANLGNIYPDDGWTFRGRSPIQITGRANYERVGDLIGQNLVGIPDLLSQPTFALEACIGWWEDRIPDSMLGETTSIRKRVNGGSLGLAEVKALTDRAAAAMRQPLTI